MIITSMRIFMNSGCDVMLLLSTRGSCSSGVKTFEFTDNSFCNQTCGHFTKRSYPGHEKVISWSRHEIESFSALYWHFVCGEFTGHRWIPSQKPVKRSFDVSLICASINGWVNNREAGDLRPHRAHYDIIVVLQNRYFILTYITQTYIKQNHHI